MPTVLLVRHGETDWNCERRIQGWAPTPLNDRGREQARATGRHIAAAYDVDRIHASDLLRTRETAELVSEAGVGVDPIFDAAWRERHFGVFQGFITGELYERHPEFDLAARGAAAVEATPEGGESLLDVHERVVDGWERLLADLDADDTAIVVTHGGPLHLLVGHVKGLDAGRAVSEGRQHNCAVNELRHDPAADTVAVVRENETNYG